MIALLASFGIGDGRLKGVGPGGRLDNSKCEVVVRGERLT